MAHGPAREGPLLDLHDRLVLGELPRLGIPAVPHHALGRYRLNAASAPGILLDDGLSRSIGDEREAGGRRFDARALERGKTIRRLRPHPGGGAADPGGGRNSGARGVSEGRARARAGPTPTAPSSLPGTTGPRRSRGSRRRRPARAACPRAPPLHSSAPAPARPPSGRDRHAAPGRRPGAPGAGAPPGRQSGGTPPPRGGRAVA